MLSGESIQQILVPARGLGLLADGASPEEVLQMARCQKLLPSQ